MSAQPPNIVRSLGNTNTLRLSFKKPRTIQVNTFGIAGTDDNNLFIVGAGFRDGLYYGVVHHYNGSDWFQFSNLALIDVILYDVWTDGREVFAVGNTTRFPQVSIVVHGK
jgi:hypothetical protein